MAKTIYLISIGKLSNRNIKAIAEDYIKRIIPFFHLKEIEIKELGYSEKQEIEREGEKILEVLIPGSFNICCDQKGINLSSEDFFEKLDKIFSNYKSTTFIIGGAFGLSEKVKAKSNFTLSLSEMTFTHQMARLIIVEQLYRYCMYKENHPFVK